LFLNKHILCFKSIFLEIRVCKWNVHLNFDLQNSD
jgi:hypothetical protein